ncbi:MAG: ADP/ATP-dependent (S)-NAD(P)H-hydrate dehydratase [bacterium]|nr:ADP/ATP-dependent (S)-NAD(P)H-hydrate dehydratase [bacterium]
MIIKTSDFETIKPILKKISIPNAISHKGQNGKVLIIGGSSLFHAASIWAAEIASHIVDIVHYSSTIENNEIMLSLKAKFLNGIVVSKDHLESYVKEDDVVLIGPGMMRRITNVKKQFPNNIQLPSNNFQTIQNLKDEGEYTYFLTKYLIEHFPNKKFVFDAGSLQMMDVNWLKLLKVKSIITPHQIEFDTLFKTNIRDLKNDEKVLLVKQKAKEFNCVILLKAIIDIVSDGNEVYVIEGGNQGLTKGGTGDVLAGLTLALYSQNDVLNSAILASILLKRAADELSKQNGYWYTIDSIIQIIPKVMHSFVENVV